MSDYLDDPRICSSLASLQKLEQLSHYAVIPELNAATSLLTGRLHSAYRGRGLNFEEFRQYQSGDDSRHIDWSVTLRTGEPHIRVYSEEKDRPIYLILDQTASMFFSSVEVMKSVVCADVAALCGWLALKSGDRIGGMVFSSTHQTRFPLSRGRAHVSMCLTEIVEYNQALPHAIARQPFKGAFTLEHALAHCLEQKLRGALVIVVSDFYAADQSLIDKLAHLTQSNSLLAVSVMDSMEHNIELDDEFSISNGEQQATLSSEHNRDLTKYHSHIAQSVSEVKKIVGCKGIPMIELDTAGDHINDFIAQLKGR